VSAGGQFSWPPAGRFMAVYGQDLMAADKHLGLSSLIEETDRLYWAHVRNGMLAMGFNLDLVEATSP